MQSIPYDRAAAIAYAHKWARGRNPAFYNYDTVGGDCTNFASQCLHAGSKVMNYAPEYGWYYTSANRKAPAWTGVPYFHQFITRKEVSPGPFGEAAELQDVQPGDFVQLKFDSADTFGHTPVIVSVGKSPRLSNILIAAHTYDTDYRPLSTYYTTDMRFIHILGVYKG